MEFTIIVSQTDIESVVAERVKTAVAQHVKTAVEYQTLKYKNQIVDAVAVYLEKKLTEKDIKDLIDSKIAEYLRNEGV